MLVKNTPSIAARAGITDSLSFSLAVIIVQLYKYSAAVCDTISLKVSFNGIQQTSTFGLIYTLSPDQSFRFVHRMVKEEIRIFFEQTPLTYVNSAVISWITDEEEPGSGNQYQVSLRTETDFREPRFSCLPAAFFYPVFKNAGRHFKNLVQNVFPSSETAIKDIDYSSPEDIKMIESFAYGPINREIGKPEFLHVLFEKTAAQYPGNTAVVYKQQSLSYDELNRKANRLAAFFIQHGIKKGDFIGILLNRTPDVYITILGILKTGAAYIPLDACYPEDRILYILNDAGVKFLVSNTDFKNSYAHFTGIILNTDRELIPVLEDSINDNNLSIPTNTESPAYVIYTSGTTGLPKGVVISHASASNLVKAEQNIFKINPADKIVQGFSPAFDASVEEIWLALLSGASLYPVPQEIMLSGAELSSFINKENISVLSTVPTLLSMMQPPLPSLRLLILGGEYCPHELLQEWSTNGLRIVNTYGPTEATVITTYEEFNSVEKNSIGRPIANAAVFITDDSLKLLPIGVPGELCIAGFGLANGYLNLDELTSEKFIEPSFMLRHDFPHRLYRSGDLARFNEKGQLEFLGRLDLQVKLRGYRIELTEIESQILQIENIKNSVVSVKEGEHKIQRLIAYVLLKNNAIAFDENSCKTFLRSRMAPYMVPSLFVVLEDFPKLASGKIDRKNLPEPEDAIVETERTIIQPHDSTEQQIHEVWEEYFSPHPVSTNDDFFYDLGGHSLLAAHVVSKLRQQKRFHDLSILDIYQNPTIEKLAYKIKSRKENEQPDNAITNEEGQGHYKSSRLRYLICGLLQLPALYVLFGIDGLMEVASFLVFYLLRANDYSIIESLTWAIIAGMIIYPLLILITIGLKWLVLGRIKPGRYQLWSWYYVRWWFVQNLVQSLHLDYLAGTPLLPLVLRMLGMRVGKNVHLETDHFAAFDITAIGDGTSVDEGASIPGYEVEKGELVIGPVSIGRHCYVGTRAVLSVNTTMEDRTRLEDLSLLRAYTILPANETWAGSPAQRSQNILQPATPPPQHNRLQRVAVMMLYVVLVFIIPLVFLIPFVPGVVFLMQLDFFANPLLYLLALPIVGTSFVVLITLEVSVLKWLLVGRVRPGRYAVHSWFYIRNWIVDKLLSMSSAYISQLHATLFVVPWYRLLGARLGKFVELSTASSSTPDQLIMDDGSTIADEASLGSPHTEGGWMTVAQTRLGSRTFVGNSAVVPAGTIMGDNSLVGVLSIVPKNEDAKRNDATWFGSPPILFPHRQPSDAFPETKTYLPTWKLRLARGSFELLRITLPPAGLIFVTVSVIITTLKLISGLGFVPALLLIPLAYAVSCATVLLVVLLAKWLIMGRYRPSVHPLWSFFVWRLELVNALYEFLAAPLALEKLQGTPFLPAYLRLMGARIGRTCYIDTTGFLEWDLVEIGNRVVLNEDCIMQTHLFEDRVLKASGLRIDDDCTVGATSVVLYNSTMEKGSCIEALSLLMKGESIPANTRWAGCPAQFVQYETSGAEIQFENTAA
jgi:non-ribosomal peptide synthetase-like protein